MTNRRAAWKLQDHVIEVVRERFPLATSAQDMGAKVQDRINRKDAMQATYARGDGAWVMTSVYKRSA